MGVREPRIGDRVTATIEGTVRYVNGDGSVDISTDEHEDFEYVPVSGLVIHAKRVGDIVEGKADYEALPPGAVAAVGSALGNLILRTPLGYVNGHGTAQMFAPFAARKIVHLPEEDSE